MSERGGFLGGVLGDNSEILFFIILFLLLFCGGFGGVGGYGYGCKD